MDGIAREGERAGKIMSQRDKPRQAVARSIFTLSFMIETPSLPRSLAAVPCCFTFYVAYPIRSVHPSTLPHSGLPSAAAIG